MENNCKSNYKYAIYGGTFDPIHRAHVTLAYYAIREVKLDELIFMPAFCNPFKQGRKVSSGADRCAMIESILHYDKAFSVSDYECSKEGPSYTFKTLEYWDEKIDGELHFLCGWDSLLELDTWYHGEDILRKYPIITGRRPGADDEEGLKKIRDYTNKYGSIVYVLDMPPMDLSATMIRNNAREGKPINGMVLPEVEEYIREHQLYK